MSNLTRLLKKLGFRLVRVRSHNTRNRDKISDEQVMNVIEDRVRDKKLYLDRNYSAIMLAREVGTNRTYISKALKSRGMTFASYINAFRIQCAMAIMSNPANSKLSISQIAEMSGFCNERALNYYLTKTAGVTASVFRKRALDLSKQ